MSIFAISYKSLAATPDMKKEGSFKLIYVASILLEETYYATSRG